MRFFDGLRDGLLPIRRPSRTSSLQAAALYSPTGPARSIVSPWADDSALSTIVWSDLFGTDENAPLTRAEAMAVPSIARARNVVATTLGRVDLEASRDELVLPEQPSVIRQPDPAQPRFITMTWTIDDLIFYGYSWWLTLTRSLVDNRPAAVRRVHPGGVEITPALAAMGQAKVYDTIVDLRDLIKIDGPHEGILNFASRTVRAAAKLERSAARFADNPVPAVELHQLDDYPMSDTEIDAMISKWAAARRGADGGVAYTSMHIEAKVHGAPAENLLTAGRNTAAIDAARIVGVPADTIDASPERSSLTYATVESKNRNLIDYGLAAYAEAVASRLSMDDIVPHGTVVKFRTDKITEPSASTPDPPAVVPAAPATEAAR